MTPQDIETVRKHPVQDSTAASIILSKGQSEVGVQLSHFCDELNTLAPHITIKKDSDIPFEDPVLVIGHHKNIAYYAVPTDKFLPLFLGAMDTDIDKEKTFAADIEKRLKALDLPASLKLYVAGQCPHCPQTIRQIQSLANHTPMLRLEIISVDLFPDKAQTENIRSVPTLVLDEEFRWTGQVHTEELLTVCANRDPSQLSATSLRQLIEDGNAEGVAGMMMESNQVFSALIELLTHQRWSVRLGAMVTVEYLADEDQRLGLNLLNVLWKDFQKLTPPVQGDITHLFGLIDADITRDYLRELASGQYDEQVKEAANEVLEEMGL